MKVEIEKSFAEFLVDRGHLSPDKFVEAAHGIIESAKPVQQLALEHDCICTEELAQIIQFQGEQGVGFKTACQHLDVWTDDMEQKLREVLRQNTKSFVTELMVVGAVGVHDITSLLDEYLGFVYEGAA